MTENASPAGPPIFVVGHQRSGTTLLQALLGSHPNIASPPETYFVSRIADLADCYGNLGDDENLRRALHDTLNREMQRSMRGQAARVGARPTRPPAGSARRSAGSEAQ
jgi:hypothetical protein